MFVYRLAQQCNIWNVEAWKRKITVRQLKRWMAFWRVEPFGDEWRRSARAALTAAAGFGAKLEPESEEQFLPSYREPQQTFEQLKAELAKIPAFRKQMEGQ